MPFHIAIDAMGGDHGMSVTVPAAADALRCYPDLTLTLVGQETQLRDAIASWPFDLRARCFVHHADEVVGNDESPSSALRNKKHSSMRLAINLVKEGQAAACVSSGNTGALMATARFVLKTLSGIDRPAIMTRFPTMNSRRPEVRVLDLGANVDSSAEHLYQFAIMGSITCAAVDSVAEPRVGLINIGEEDIKGNDQVKRAAELFSSSPFLNYTGFLEGDRMFYGDVDVAVCDGFVGNSMLKACEGISKYISYEMRRAVSQTWWIRLLALAALPVFRRLKKQIDPRKHNGATLLGLNGIVIKSHGGADVVAFRVAIDEAIREVRKNVPELIRQRVETVMSADAASKQE